MDHNQPPFIDDFSFTTDSVWAALRRVINVMPAAFASSFTFAAHTGPSAKAASNHSFASVRADTPCGAISDCITSSAVMETGWDSHITRDVDRGPALVAMVTGSIRNAKPSL